MEIVEGDGGLGAEVLVDRPLGTDLGGGQPLVGALELVRVGGSKIEIGIENGECAEGRERPESTIFARPPPALDDQTVEAKIIGPKHSRAEKRVVDTAQRNRPVGLGDGLLVFQETAIQPNGVFAEVAALARARRSEALVLRDRGIAFAGGEAEAAGESFLKVDLRAKPGAQPRAVTILIGIGQRGIGRALDVIRR